MKAIGKGCLLFLGITLVLGLIGAIFGINDNKEDAESSGKLSTVVSNDSTKNTKESDSSAESSKPENWNYTEQLDEMTEKTTYFATCTSTNSEQFDFPYNDPCYMYIIVRQSPKYGKDVYISITCGQFNVKYPNTPVRFKFDDGKVETYRFNSSDDGSHDILFSNNAKSLIAKLKKSKTLKIETEFFQAGNRVFRFNTEGLVWEH